MNYPDRGVNVELFKADPPLYLEKVIKDYIASSPLNCIPELGHQPIFDEPVVAFADGDDPAFQAIKDSTGDFLLTPRECLETLLPLARPRTIKHVGVISLAAPFHRDTRIAERGAVGCSLHFSYTRFRGGLIPSIPSFGLLDRLTQYLESLLTNLGHLAVCPSQPGVWNQDFERGKVTCRSAISNWSDRHVAEACGLGTFGLNGSIITAKGVAVYLASLVCDVRFPHAEKIKEPNCSFYRDRQCRQCIDHCPAGAISERGRDPLKCHAYSMYGLPELMAAEGRSNEQIGFYFPCAKCLIGLPCEDRVPPRIELEDGFCGGSC